MLYPSHQTQSHKSLYYFLDILMPYLWHYPCFPPMVMRHTSNRAFQKSIAGQVCSIILSACFLSLAGCGSGEQGDLPITTTATPTGVTVSLQWYAVEPDPGHPKILRYILYYGKQSSGQSGSCSYEDSIRVSPGSGPTVSATIRGLEPETRYYFAVSAHNGLESPCSREISGVTPPLEI